MSSKVAVIHKGKVKVTVPAVTSQEFVADEKDPLFGSWREVIVTPEKEVTIQLPKAQMYGGLAIGKVHEVDANLAAYLIKVKGFERAGAKAKGDDEAADVMAATDASAEEALEESFEKQADIDPNFVIEDAPKKKTKGGK